MEATTITEIRRFSLFSITKSSVLSNATTHFNIAKPPFSAFPLSSLTTINYARTEKNTPRTPDRSLRRHPTGVVEKTQKLNLEISPHRAVATVRLMRIELGGAFADLLNEKGKGSGSNEMAYVERTLGFRTKDLDERDLRLVLLYLYLFLHIKSISYLNLS